MEPTTDQGPKWNITACSAPACRAGTIWAYTESGERTLINAAPAEQGRWLLVDTGLDSPVARFVAEKDRAQYAGQLRSSHWATCPNAEDFRRKRNNAKRWA